MQKGIIGRKIGMTQIFDQNGNVVPVTVVEAGPCVVAQKKTVENDGYASIQVGFGDLKPNKVNKPMKGHFAKGDVAPKRALREFRLENTEAYNVGDLIKADVFAEGEKVDVTGTSKGHGFSGVIKRWNSHRLKETHGVGPVHREVGSLGANSDPSRVFPGKHMPGQYGGEQVTVLNLTVVKVDTARNVLLIKGAVPGARNGIVYIREAVKK